MTQEERQQHIQTITLDLVKADGEILQQFQAEFAGKEVPMAGVYALFMARFAALGNAFVTLCTVLAEDETRIVLPGR